MEKSIGPLEDVKLRKLWPHEASGVFARLEQHLDCVGRATAHNFLNPEGEIDAAFT